MNLIKIMIIFIGLLFINIPTCYAKTIPLYSEANETSKTLGTINSDSGMIPIFSPKGSKWIKVGDPNNGNVGWVKMSDLSNSDFTFTQHTFSTGKDAKSYQVVQYGNSQTMSPAEVQAIFQKLYRQQKQLELNTQQMLKEMYKNLEQPMLPIIIMPAPSAPVSKKSGNTH